MGPKDSTLTWSSTPVCTVSNTGVATDDPEPEPEPEHGTSTGNTSQHASNGSNGSNVTNNATTVAPATATAAPAAAAGVASDAFIVKPAFFAVSSVISVFIWQQ